MGAVGRSAMIVEGGSGPSREKNIIQKIAFSDLDPSTLRTLPNHPAFHVHVSQR